MKKLLIIALVFVLSFAMVACSPEGLLDAMTDATTTGELTTAGEVVTNELTTDDSTADDSTADELTTTEETTEAADETVLSEEKREEIRASYKFDNVTMKMTGSFRSGSDFDCTIYFVDDLCVMFEGDSSNPERFEGEDADMVRSIFVETALAVLAHGDNFILTDEGYLCKDAVTYECDIIDVGRATIVATNNLVKLNDNGDLLSLTCAMYQTCDGEVVDITSVTFAFTNYGTTVIEDATK